MGDFKVYLQPQIAKKVEEAIEQVKLTEFFPISSLSGGEGIVAISLVGDPKIIFLDELSTGLDR